MSETRIPTLKDVAKQAGVHVATASRALNDEQHHRVSEETRLRVTAAASALGYRANAVAQSLRKGTTGTIGVIVADLANSFNAAILRGIEQGTRSRGILPLVVETHDDPEILRSAVTRLLGNRVDAIILCAAHTTDEKFVADLEKKVPLVLAVRGFNGQTEHEQGGEHFEVLHDDFLGAGTAVNHLLRLGHRRIAQLPGNQLIFSFIERGAGYQAALNDHPNATDLSTGSHALESSVAEGRRLAAEVLRTHREHPPTAIFAHNDLMAVGALDALRDAGLSCPQDVSVIGYNDAPLIDHIDPPLTTVRLPSFELGRHSARLALNAIADPSLPAARLVLAPEFIERKSTLPPKT